MSVLIVLPIPPSKLHSHNTGHWRTKAPLIRKCRLESMFVCNLAHEKMLVAPVEVSYDFYLKDNRARDCANLVQSCKAYIDGIVDSGLIYDDKWQVLSIGHVKCHIDKENPRVELRFEETGIPNE